MPKKPSKKYRVALNDFGHFASVVLNMTDAELMLLKAHLLVERVLVATAAARLREDDHENVPKLSFAVLIDLATSDDGDRKSLIWFNDLRNALAHDFDALDGSEFREKIGRLGLPWPDHPAHRAGVIRALFNYVSLIAMKTYFDHSTDQLTLERATALPAVAEPWLEQAVKIRSSIEDARMFLEKVKSGDANSLEATPPPITPRDPEMTSDPLLSDGSP